MTASRKHGTPKPSGSAADTLLHIRRQFEVMPFGGAAAFKWAGSLAPEPMRPAPTLAEIDENLARLRSALVDVGSALAEANEEKARLRREVAELRKVLAATVV